MAVFHARRFLPRLCWVLCWLVMSAVIVYLPESPEITGDRDLPQIQAMEGSRILASRDTPRGLITLFDAPSFHLAPGLALTTPAKVPPNNRSSSMDRLPVPSILPMHRMILSF